MNGAPAGMVLTSGKILTLDARDSVAQAVAVAGDRIIDVGTDAAIRRWVGPETEVIDLKGRTVVPGMIDTHCHVIGAALFRATIDALDLSREAGITCIPDIIESIRSRAGSVPPGHWILGTGADDGKLAEGRNPSLAELSEAAPDHPVSITTAGGHFSLVNRKAFELAGVTEDTPDPPGGQFERNPATGALTGGVVERAREMVRPASFPDPDLQSGETARRLVAELRACAAKGVTCLYEMGDMGVLRAARYLREMRLLPLRIRMDVGIDTVGSAGAGGRCPAPSLEGGDDWFRLCGAKIVLDGGVSSRTAAVSETYLHRPGFYGVLSMTPEAALDRIRGPYAAGHRISAHANGDRAIAMYLSLMEGLQSQYPRPDARNRIIHCSVVTPELVERIRAAGLLPTVFGAYAYYHGDKLLPAFGPERMERMFAARSFLDAGVKVAAHSDFDASPISPFLGVHALVNRRSSSDRPVGESQKVSVMEALRMYTANAAFHSFEERSLGTIETGKHADMVVLGDDILDMPTARILETRVELTMVHGNVVFSDGALLPALRPGADESAR